MYHTMGQRQGLGIGGVKNTPDAPWYVVDKNLDTNQLIVVQGDEHPLLYHQQLTATQMPFNCHAKIRYRQPDQACQVSVKENGVIDVVFEQPQRAVTPGQSIVLYHGERCLGGAVIETRSNQTIDSSQQSAANK